MKSYEGSKKEKTSIWKFFGGLGCPLALDKYWICQIWVELMNRPNKFKKCFKN